MATRAQEQINGRPARLTWVCSPHICCSCSPQMIPWSKPLHGWGTTDRSGPHVNACYTGQAWTRILWFRTGTRLLLPGDCTNASSSDHLYWSVLCPVPSWMRCGQIGMGRDGTGRDRTATLPKAAGPQRQTSCLSQRKSLIKKKPNPQNK